MSPAESPSRGENAFTLIELLVVMAIISILAGLGFAAVNGALFSARKAEVRSVASQVKLALTAYYSDYGVWPANVTVTDTGFLNMMTGADLSRNRRGIRYLEAPPKFTNGSGLVTPRGFYSKTEQRNFNVVLDTNYDGKISVPGVSGDIAGSVAVYVADPKDASKYIGTW